MQMVNEVEEESRKADQEMFETAVLYKEGAEQEIARCRALGIEPPEMIPHPDDILVDPRTGEVRFIGPFLPEEKARLDEMLLRRDEAQEEIRDFAARHARTRSARMKEFLLAEWHHEQLMFDIVNDNVSERYRTRLEYRSYAAGASQPGQANSIMMARRKARSKNRT